MGTCAVRFPTASSYSPLQKAAHWLIVALCLSQFPTAWAIQRTHMAPMFGLRPAPFDLFLHKVHAWSGWTILMLAILLVTLRFLRGAPDLPAGMAVWQRSVARVAHFCLYAGVVALAITGTGAMYLSGRFAPIHIALIKIGIGLITLHALAVLWHQFVRGDALLLRMLPSRRRAGATLGVSAPSFWKRRTKADSAISETNLI